MEGFYKLDENGNKKYLSDRTITLSYAERDTLKQNILTSAYPTQRDCDQPELQVS